eukprot:15145752-Alexandrium_andersonii.AAC.1
MTRPHSGTQAWIALASSTSRSFRGSARSAFQSPATDQGPCQSGCWRRKPRAAGLEPVGT